MTTSSATGGYLAPSSPPPPEDAALDVILQSLVSSITSMPGNLCRPRWQTIPPDQPEASVNWCALGVVDETPEPAMHSRHSGAGAGSTTTQTNVTVQILASFYGPKSRGNAALFRDGLMVAQNREPLQLLGIGLVAIPDPVRFVPALVNQINIARADVSFRLVVPFVRIWPILNLLAAQGSIVGEDGDRFVFETATP